MLCVNVHQDAGERRGDDESDSRGRHHRHGHQRGRANGRLVSDVIGSRDLLVHDDVIVSSDSDRRTRTRVQRMKYANTHRIIANKK